MKVAAPQFLKLDGDKPRTDLLPPWALLRVSEVLAYGARKYAPGNWARAPTRGRYVGAALRHLLAYMAGEDRDESGLSHLAHAACSLLFLIEMQERQLSVDDRFKPDPPPRRSREPKPRSEAAGPPRPGAPRPRRRPDRVRPAAVQGRPAR